jgi:hypothetical protein
VIQLAKAIGIPISKNFNELGFKTREAANLLKEKLIAYLCLVIRESNVHEFASDEKTED